MIMHPNVVTLAERPDLADQLYDLFEGTWPEFVLGDPVDPLLDPLTAVAYPHLSLVAVDPATDQPVAKAHTLPFTWSGDPDQELPAGGYDAVLLGAANNRLAGSTGNLLALVEVAVRRDAQGSGLARVMLDAVRSAAAEQGYRSVVAPLRPTGAHQYPDVPLGEYASWTREDGLPVDPWLRLQVRAGARIVGVAPRSMVVAATLQEWRDWTGLPFDTDGPIHVPGALAPVRCDVACGVAVYVQPNIWIHHKLW